MPSLPPVAKPSKRVFDPWNSSSTGHQYAENRLSSSTSWRDSRTAKLAAQFGDQSRAGGGRIYDTVGAGALGFGKDGRKETGEWDESSVRGARGKSGMSANDVGRTGDIGAWLRGEKEGLRGGVVQALKRERSEQEAVIQDREQKRRKIDEDEAKKRADERVLGLQRTESTETHWTESTVNLEDLPEELQRPTTAKSVVSLREEYDLAKASESPEPVRIEPDPEIDPLLEPDKTTIFQNCNFYINGSTMPLISDHRLKFLITQHGGQMSIALGIKTVSHVILGTPNSKGGVGGGLAGSKIQKEIQKIRGKGVKFVGVEWLLESVKAGKRLSEARFASSRVSLAPKGVQSVHGIFKQTKPGAKQAMGLKKPPKPA